MLQLFTMFTCLKRTLALFKQSAGTSKNPHWAFTKTSNLLLKCVIELWIILLFIFSVTQIAVNISSSYQTNVQNNLACFISFCKSFFHHSAGQRSQILQRFIFCTLCSTEQLKKDQIAESEGSTKRFCSIAQWRIDYFQPNSLWKMMTCIFDRVDLVVERKCWHYLLVIRAQSCVFYDGSLGYIFIFFNS